MKRGLQLLLLTLPAGFIHAVQIPHFGEKRQIDPCSTPECLIAAGDIIADMDQTVDPCVDFYEFACGGWLQSNSIPATSSSVSQIGNLAQAVDEEIRRMFETPAGAGDAQAVVDIKLLYQACLDEAAVEEQGVGGFLSMVGPADAYGGMPLLQADYDGRRFDREALSAANERRFLTSGLFRAYAGVDNMNTQQKAVHLDQITLFLPRDFYVEPDLFGDQIALYNQYLIDLTKVLATELRPDLQEQELRDEVDRVVELEIQLAEITIPPEDRRDALDMYNPMAVSTLKESYGLQWDTFFAVLFSNTDVSTLIDSDIVVVREPTYFENLDVVLARTNPTTVANYLYFRRLLQFVDDGPAVMRDIKFAFDSQLTGQTEQTPRDALCVNKATSRTQGLDFAAGAEFIRTYFLEESKVMAEELASGVREAFKELVTESTWMDSDTQVLANEKEDMVTQNVAYPDWAMDNDELDNFYAGRAPVSLDNHLQNVLNMVSWVSGKSMSSLNDAPDLDVWTSAPIVVNANYDPSLNTLTIPAAFLREPFFGNGYPRYLNYGGIGQVMGHENTHGFDDQGRQYDGSGNIQQWWSDETIAAFETAAQCIVDQYESFTVPELEEELGEDAHLNGVLTQGENIADNGGLREAFRAYQNSVEELGTEPRLLGLEQYTPEQMLFINFGRVLCEKMTDEILLDMVLENPHSPPRYRVIGSVSNSEEFARAFNCPVGSPMNPESKCVVW